MNFTEEQLAKLEEHAIAATQQTWTFGHSGTQSMEEAIAWFTDMLNSNDSPDLWGAFCDPDGPGCVCPALTGNGPTSRANSEYLVVAQPRNMLLLLADLKATRVALQRAIVRLDGELP